jgi:predicted PurR-regulated permease PerM
MVRLTRKHAWAALAIIFLTLILWVLSKHWGNLLNLAGMLVIGIIIAYLLTPLCDLLERKLPRAAAITLILLMVCSALAAFALLFIPRMVREALALVDRFPMIMESVQIILGNLQNHMETMGIPKGIQSSVAAYADELQQKTTDTVMRFLEKTISGISVLPALFIVTRFTTCSIGVSDIIHRIFCQFGRNKDHSHKTVTSSFRSFLLPC